MSSYEFECSVGSGAFVRCRVGGVVRGDVEACGSPSLVDRDWERSIRGAMAAFVGGISDGVSSGGGRLFNIDGGLLSDAGAARPVEVEPGLGVLVSCRRNFDGGKGGCCCFTSENSGCADDVCDVLDNGGSDSPKVQGVGDEIGGAGGPDVDSVGSSVDNFPSFGVQRGGVGVTVGSEVRVEAGLPRHSPEVILSSSCVENGETKLERNRRWRKEKKMKKARRRARAWESKNWNEEKKKKVFFSECDVTLRKDLVETRAARLIAENKVKVREISDRMAYMDLQDKSRIREREFENSRVRLEIATRKNSEKVSGGFVETVISSGTVSPNSSISVAEENRLRKELADANDKLSKVSTAVNSVDKKDTPEFKARFLEYENAILKMESHYARSDSHLVGDYDRDKEELMDAFADVAYTEKELEKKKTIEQVLKVLGPRMNADNFEDLIEAGLLSKQYSFYL